MLVRATCVPGEIVDEERAIIPEKGFSPTLLPSLLQLLLLWEEAVIGLWTVVARWGKGGKKGEGGAGVRVGLREGLSAEW